MIIGGIEMQIAFPSSITMSGISLITRPSVPSWFPRTCGLRPAFAQQFQTYDGNKMTSIPHIHIIPITLNVNDRTKLVYYETIKHAAQYWEQNLKKIDYRTCLT